MATTRAGVRLRRMAGAIVLWAAQGAGGLLPGGEAGPATPPAQSAAIVALMDLGTVALRSDEKHR